jgi:hypothetical protein
MMADRALYLSREHLFNSLQSQNAARTATTGERLDEVLGVCEAVAEICAIPCDDMEATACNPTSQFYYNGFPIYI